MITDEIPPSQVDAPYIPHELLVLECEDPLTCGIHGTDASLCRSCREQAAWLEQQEQARHEANLIAARARIEWENEKETKKMAERERLVPLLRDLRSLVEVFGEEWRELLARPTGEIIAVLKERGML